MNTARTSSEVRKTKETDIQLDLNIAVSMRWIPGSVFLTIC